MAITYETVLLLLRRCSHLRYLCIHTFGIPAQGQSSEAREFLSVPFYDKMENKELGTPVFMGKDELGWDVYIMGMKNAKQLVITSMKSYLNACGLDQKSFVLVNALVELHPVTSIGGMLSRRLGLVFPGRPMTVWGIRKTYPKFAALVEQVKENLAARQELS